VPFERRTEDGQPFTSEPAAISASGIAAKSSIMRQFTIMTQLRTDRGLKRGVFRSVIKLSQAIQDYLDAHNANPKALPLQCDGAIQA
jgi:hypothetical protein